MNDNAQELIDCVLCTFGYERQKLMNSRDFPMPVIRGMMYITLVDKGYTTTDAGKVFGRDHSTVCYWLRKVNVLAEYDKEVKRLYEIYKSITE